MKISLLQALKMVETNQVRMVDLDRTHSSSTPRMTPPSTESNEEGMAAGSTSRDFMLGAVLDEILLARAARGLRAGLAGPFGRSTVCWMSVGSK